MSKSSVWFYSWHNKTHWRAYFKYGTKKRTLYTSLDITGPTQEKVLEKAAIAAKLKCDKMKWNAVIDTKITGALQ